MVVPTLYYSKGIELKWLSLKRKPFQFFCIKLAPNIKVFLRNV